MENGGKDYTQTKDTHGGKGTTHTEGGEGLETKGGGGPKIEGDGSEGPQTESQGGEGHTVVMLTLIKIMTSLSTLVQ